MIKVLICSLAVLSFRPCVNGAGFLQRDTKPPKTVEISALFDYTTNTLFFKDEGTCYAENLGRIGLHNETTLLISKNDGIVPLTNDFQKEFANSHLAKSFCGNLPIFIYPTFIESFSEEVLHRRKRSLQNKVNHYVGQPWPQQGPASQTQIQGQVSGQGFFSGQAQSQQGGSSQSQVQLSGNGILGSVSSSAGNAQAQIALASGTGSGQASSLGLGPSNSQVQVNLGDQGRGSLASASVLAAQGGLGSTSNGHGYEGHQTNNLKLGSYPGQELRQYPPSQSLPGGNGGQQSYGNGGQPALLPSGHSGQLYTSGFELSRGGQNGATNQHSGAARTLPLSFTQRGPVSNEGYGGGSISQQLSNDRSVHNGAAFGSQQFAGDRADQNQPGLGSRQFSSDLSGSNGAGLGSQQFSGDRTGQNQPGFGPQQFASDLSGSNGGGVGSQQLSGDPYSHSQTTANNIGGNGYYQQSNGAGHGSPQATASSNGIGDLQLRGSQNVGTSRNDYANHDSSLPSGDSEIRRPSPDRGAHTSYPAVQPVRSSGNGGNIYHPRSTLNGHSSSNEGELNPVYSNNGGRRNGYYTSPGYSQSSSGGLPHAFASSTGGGQAQAQTVYLGPGTSDFYSNNNRASYGPTSYQGQAGPQGSNGHTRVQNQYVSYHQGGQNGQGSRVSTNGHRTTTTTTTNGGTYNYRQTGQGQTYTNGNTGRSTDTNGYATSSRTAANGDSYVRPSVNGQQPIVPRDNSLGYGSGGNYGQSGQLPTHGLPSPAPTGAFPSGHISPSPGFTEQGTPAAAETSDAAHFQPHGTARTYIPSTHHQPQGTSLQSGVGPGLYFSENDNTRQQQNYIPPLSPTPSNQLSTGTLNQFIRRPQEQDGFAPSYASITQVSPHDPGTQRCTVFTFTCTIIFESNGRAKICKPNMAQINGNGHIDGGSKPSSTGGICCC